MLKKYILIFLLYFGSLGNIIN